MKRIIFAFAIIAVILAVPAGAAVIDFDTNSVFDIVSGPGVYSDLVFSNEGRLITVAGHTLGPDFTAPRCAIGQFLDEVFLPYRADFLITGIGFVSVTLGDYSDDRDELFIRAYDSSGTLLDEDNYSLPNTVNGGATLSVSASNISYVIFGADAAYGNSAYFDNFAYEVVPEPGSLAMLAGGLLSLGGLIKLRKR